MTLARWRKRSQGLSLPNHEHAASTAVHGQFSLGEEEASYGEVGRPASSHKVGLWAGVKGGGEGENPHLTSHSMVPIATDLHRSQHLIL